ncbi:MAG: tRNA (adenosine(37)-N6)-threonylcarbamoyltransferase complex dimerization subunit type 1 TsaB [Pirellulales bacterium]
MLSIETSIDLGSVALWEAGEMLDQADMPPGQRTAQSLAPSVAALLAKRGWAPRDIRLVAVSIGPGSFTGLRIGVTTAKTFAYAVGAEVIGVSTIEAIAQRAAGDLVEVAVAMDAQRGDVFAGTCRRSGGGVMRLTGPVELVPAQPWLEGRPRGSYVTGPALRKLAERLPPGVTAVAPEFWSPVAESGGLVGWRRFEAGDRDDLWKLAPLYFRRSAAEEKWEARS